MSGIRTVAPPSASDDRGRVRARLCVLASSSAGNCSVLKVLGPRGQRWIGLIDAGLSPRRTRLLLAQRGVELDAVDDVLLTHLDRDHWHRAWGIGRHWSASVRIHDRHLGRARAQRVIPRRCEPFAETFEPTPGVRVSPLLMAHDSLGTAAFRIEIEGAGALGFATDLGRVSDALVDHLADVDVLAIESNYCPRMQRASARPAFLKDRIMGGRGHLSNHEAAEATAGIRPRRGAVFLHLSRQCNTPELVADMHAGAPYETTIAAPLEPTRWVTIAPPACAAPARDDAAARPAPIPDSLFGAVRADEP